MIHVARLHDIRLDQVMDQYGLFRGQAIILMILSERDGLTHSEISEKLKISPAAATKVIKRMEELKFLRRQQDTNDERVSRVYLQPDGKAVSEQIHSTFTTTDQYMLNGFSPEELDRLEEYLNRMTENLRQLTPGACHFEPHRADAEKL